MTSVSNALFRDNISVIVIVITITTTFILPTVPSFLSFFLLFSFTFSSFFSFFLSFSFFLLLHLVLRVGFSDFHSLPFSYSITVSHTSLLDFIFFVFRMNFCSQVQCPSSFLKVVPVFKHCTRKSCSRVEGKLHKFLILTIDGIEWLAT